MQNSIFVNYKNILLVTHHGKNLAGNHGNGYDDYNTPNAIIEEKTFTTPSCTNKQLTSAIHLRQKIKQDKLTVLYK